MPDENTIRHYRNRLTQSGTPAALMKAFDRHLHEQGYLAMGGQIVDATLVPAPRQRNTEGEKAAVKAGRSAKQIWRGKPGKAHQKDADARWTLKIGGKTRFRPDGTPLPQIATPVSGYKNHISIDQRYGFIRKATVTSAAQSDGRQLRHVIDTNNTASDVWADTAYRSQKNERWLATQGKAVSTEGSPRANPCQNAHHAPMRESHRCGQRLSMCLRIKRAATASSFGPSVLPAPGLNSRSQTLLVTLIASSSTNEEAVQDRCA